MIKFMDKVDYIKTILYLKLNLFRSADILITTRCSTGCRFCIYKGIPKKDMPFKTIEKGLSLYKKLNIKKIRISGGEPFEAYDKLFYIVKKILKFWHPKNIYLITSGNWAIEKEKIEQMLNPLIEMGLKNFIISIDAFHLEKINTRNILMLLDYFKKRGIKVRINVRYNNRIKKHIKFFHLIKNNYNIAFSTFRVARVGGAASLSEKETNIDMKKLLEFRKIFDKQSKLRDIIKMILGSCLYLTLFPNGDLHFCCVKRENTKICNINTDNFYMCLQAINNCCLDNIYRSMLVHSNLHYEICEFCPICTKNKTI